MADDKEFECITCSQLVSRMASKQMQMSRADVKMAVRVTLDYMSDVLSRGQRIEVRGFGSFSVRFRKPRMTRNPKTRRTVFITGRSLPCFKSSTLLLDRVNKRPRGYTLLDPGYPEEHRAPAGAEIVPAIEDMPHEAPAQTEAAENRPGGTDAQTGFGAQPDAGAPHNAGARANAGAQGNAGAHADTDAQAGAGAQAGAESQGNTGTQGNTGAHADTGAQADAGTAPGAPAAMNAGADAARGGRDEGRDDAAPPERDSGAV